MRAAETPSALGHGGLPGFDDRGGIDAVAELIAGRAAYFHDEGSGDKAGN